MESATRIADDVANTRALPAMNPFLEGSSGF